MGGKQVSINPTADDLSNITVEVYEHIRKQMLRKDKRKDLYKLIIGDEKFDGDKWRQYVNGAVKDMKASGFIIINTLGSVIKK
ncbi:hypothetical protein [Pelagibaculum spongiae]|uniref:Uncharacterized protein n=1 Tax=Pelagibaculum spongiae TaxID=2080658 RepID=A0A2V1GZ83_9GAMM|nr:hypothetical protein [Pelagibaculum spongiae]PVZ71749.1 hypothetical protein DC094_01605 [Pelagibaculum spongiae]